VPLWSRGLCSVVAACPGRDEGRIRGVEVGGDLVAGSFHQYLHQAGGEVQRVARLGAVNGPGRAVPVAVVGGLGCQGAADKGSKSQFYARVL